MFRYLSKSRIMSGLQCPKRLWLEANQPTLAEVDARTERSFAVGHSVGAIARTLWPDGHLVGHDHELDAAIAETRRVLAAHPDRPLFEGTFRHDGVMLNPRVAARRLVPYLQNLEQNDKDFDEEAQKTPDPKNLANSGWVRVPRLKPRFGDLYQRSGWCFARVQKGLRDSLDVPRKGVVAVTRLAHGPHNWFRLRRVRFHIDKT